MNITLRNFALKKNSLKKNFIKKKLKNLLNSENQILASCKKSYKDSYTKKFLLRLNKKKQITLIGMGGSILGTKAIHKFLNPKLKKFSFVDGYTYDLGKSSKKNVNLIISKSGNTLETISNSNVLIGPKQENIFITENKKSYLMDLANQLKSEVVHHNNFIGGRYSVLSEVGMLPAELMGFKPERFRRLNSLIKSKALLNSLVQNVSSILQLIKKKKFNSVILNYDERSDDLFKWYQQLVAESLGKNGKGVFPVISSMPRDNHSLMQYYLDGIKNQFFTFFFVKEKTNRKLKINKLFKSHYYLKKKGLSDIAYSQFIATENVFKIKKIPYRSFVIKNRNEEALGELFTFFMLETILLGQAMKVNPFNQPSVELIKKETTKVLINS